MDFDDTREDAEFRAEFRAWLAENVEPLPPGSVLDLEGRFKRAGRFLTKKGAKGYAAITWPKEYGGLGGSEIQRCIFLPEQLYFDMENFHGADFFSVGLGFSGRPITAAGSVDRQRQLFSSIFDARA